MCVCVCVCVYKAMLSLFVIYFPLHTLKNLVSTLKLGSLAYTNSHTHEFRFSAAVYVNDSLSATCRTHTENTTCYSIHKHTHTHAADIALPVTLKHV